MPELIQISFDSELIAKLASQGWRPSEFRVPKKGDVIEDGPEPYTVRIDWQNNSNAIILTPIPKPKRYRPPTFADLAKKCPLECEFKTYPDSEWRNGTLTGIDRTSTNVLVFYVNGIRTRFCRIEATDD